MKIKVSRNEKETVSIPVTGDYSSGTYYFTVKADRTLTSARLIDKAPATNTYDSGTGITTFTVIILASDTAGLSTDKYHWDLKKEVDSDDKTTLAEGALFLSGSVRNPTDGLTTSLTTFSVTELDPTDYDANDVIISDSTQFLGKSIAEYKALLGMPVGKFLTSIQMTGNGVSTSVLHLEFMSYVDTDSWGALSFTRESTGLYKITMPNSKDYTTTKMTAKLTNYQTSSMKDASSLEKASWSQQYQFDLYFDSTVLYIRVFNTSGVLVDPLSGDNFAWLLDLEWWA